MKKWTAQRWILKGSALLPWWCTGAVQWPIRHTYTQWAVMSFPNELTYLHRGGVHWYSFPCEPHYKGNDQRRRPTLYLLNQLGSWNAGRARVHYTQMFLYFWKPKSIDWRRSIRRSQFACCQSFFSSYKRCWMNMEDRSQSHPLFAWLHCIVKLFWNAQKHPTHANKRDLGSTKKNWICIMHRKQFFPSILAHKMILNFPETIFFVG